jgi:hypothetical protein
MFIVDDQIHSIKNTAHNIFYKVYFIINLENFNLLNILSCIILMIFVTLAKQKYKTP